MRRWKSREWRRRPCCGTCLSAEGGSSWGYPKARWEREGRMIETEWGSRTEGGAPWVEWHDPLKLDYMLAPATFDTVLYLEFHESDFNWFDLVRRA